jgi:cobaltochelatase CobS
MYIQVNGNNRTAAKRVLNMLGHDSRKVRVMTYSQLSELLVRAVNQNLITFQGVMRALQTKSEREQQGYEGKGQGESESEGEGEGEQQQGEQQQGDDNAKDNKESGEKSEGDSDSESNDDGSSNDSNSSDGDSDSDSDSEDGDSDSEKDSESNSEDEKDSESNEDEKDSEQKDDDDDSEIEHAMLKTIIKYVLAGLNVALVGPAGTGKSFIAAQVAEKIGRSFHVNGAMLSKYDLIGFVDAAGTYHRTPAYDAFTTGGVHCFDELDASAPDAVVAFNGMTDDQSFYTFPNGQQQMHADYIAIACMNTFGNGATAQYVGRYKQDAAAMDRFVPVYIDYDARVEDRIGDADIVDRVRQVRTACDLLGIQHVCSYRMIKKATKARAAKATRAEIDRDIIFARLDADTIKQIKAQTAAAKKSEGF